MAKGDLHDDRSRHDPMGGGICTIQNAARPRCEARPLPISILACTMVKTRSHEGKPPPAAESNVVFTNYNGIQVVLESRHDATSVDHRRIRGSNVTRCEGRRTTRTNSACPGVERGSGICQTRPHVHRDHALAADRYLGLVLRGRADQARRALHQGQTRPVERRRGHRLVHAGRSRQGRSSTPSAWRS